MPENGGSEPGANLQMKLVVYIVAAAIVVLVGAFTYRILDKKGCHILEGGVSTGNLVFFKCDPSAPEAGTPRTEPKKISSAPEASPPRIDPDETSEGAYAAPTLVNPKGYIFYHVRHGHPLTDYGNVEPLDKSFKRMAHAPAFADVKEGLLLRALGPKSMRIRPFRGAEVEDFSRGQCFRVIEGSRIEIHSNPGPGKSGGWLPVELEDCPKP